MTSLQGRTIIAHKTGEPRDSSDEMAQLFDDDVCRLLDIPSQKPSDAALAEPERLQSSPSMTHTAETVRGVSLIHTALPQKSESGVENDDNTLCGAGNRTLNVGNECIQIETAGGVEDSCDGIDKQDDWRNLMGLFPPVVPASQAEENTSTVSSLQHPLPTGSEEVEEPPPIPPRIRPQRRILSTSNEADTHRRTRVVGLSTEKGSGHLSVRLLQPSTRPEKQMPRPEYADPNILQVTQKPGDSVDSPEAGDWVITSANVPDFLLASPSSECVEFAESRDQAALLSDIPHHREDSSVDDHDHTMPRSQRSLGLRGDMSASTPAPSASEWASSPAGIEPEYDSRLRCSIIANDTSPISAADKPEESLRREGYSVSQDLHHLLTPDRSIFDLSPLPRSTSFPRDSQLFADDILGHSSPALEARKFARKWSLQNLRTRSDQLGTTAPPSPSSRSLTFHFRMPSPRLLKQVSFDGLRSRKQMSGSSTSGTVAHSPTSSIEETIGATPSESDTATSSHASDQERSDPLDKSSQS